MALYYSGRIVVPSTSKTSLHDRFTNLMKNRPSSLGSASMPAKPATEKNKKLAAAMETRPDVQHALYAEKRRGLESRLGWNNQNKRKQIGRQGPYKGGRAKLNEAELDQELDSYVKKRKQMTQEKPASNNNDDGDVLNADAGETAIDKISEVEKTESKSESKNESTEVPDDKEPTASTEAADV